MSTESTTALQDSIGRLAAELALADQKGVRSHDFQSSLIAIAALAGSQGHNEVASAATEVCTALQDSSLDQFQILDKLNGGLERLKGTLDQSGRAKGSAGLRNIPGSGANCRLCTRSA